MTSVVNDALVQSLAKEFFWRLLSTMGTHFSDEDLAACLLEQIKGSKISHQVDGTYVINEYERYRAVVQNIRHPHTVRHFQLHYFLPLSDSGGLLNTERNSPDYSFNIENVHTEDPNTLGAMVLGIWNARMTDVRKKFATTRTVVLIKGDDLSTVSVFEEEALKYLPEDYEWDWNGNNNLEGYLKGTNEKKFTWQPHGSQFTISTNVPDDRLKIRIKRPELLNRDEVLTQLKFDPSWIEIVK